MKYLSLFSGIEAATVAWHKLGWEPVGFSEIEPFPCAVLQHHYPNITNYGDITNHAEWKLPKDIDLIVGGSPCQSFSVAGLRKGLADPRGNLMLTYLAVVERVRPRWVVWENVPGVLSSDGGRALGTFLGALGQLGYGWAYRVLDAQWVRTHGHPRAVPQRRRRVFVVGCLGDWARAAQVLFERESVQRDSAKGRATRKGTTADAEAGVGAGRWPATVASTLNHAFGDKLGLEDQHALHGAPLFVLSSGQANASITSNVGPSLDCLHEPPIVMTQPTWPAEVAPTLARGNGAPGYSDQEIFSQGAGNLVPQPVPYDLFQITAPVNRQNRKPGDPCHTLARDNAAHAAVVGTDLYNGAITGDVAATMGTPGSSVNASGPTVMAFDWQSGGDSRGLDPKDTAQLQRCQTPAVAYALRGDGFDASEDGTGRGTSLVPQAMTVRRLTPRECERLQGFPDDYTEIPWRGKTADECPDGPRYKALGNSMAVNCMAWIGERIGERHA